MTFGSKPLMNIKMQKNRLYELSNEAANDVLDIARYTIAYFGISQANKYKKELEGCFQFLGENIFLGQDASEYVEGLRRFFFKAHYIYYKPLDEEGIFIVRVLNPRMDTQGQF